MRIRMLLVREEALDNLRAEIELHLEDEDARIPR